jgi:hypothetical protein
MRTNSTAVRTALTSWKLPYPIGITSKMPARKYMTPTPYWANVSTSIGDPCRIALAGPT